MMVVLLVASGCGKVETDSSTSTRKPEVTQAEIDEAFRSRSVQTLDQLKSKLGDDEYAWWATSGIFPTKKTQSRL
jgi:hypothetical protein